MAQPDVAAVQNSLGSFALATALSGSLEVRAVHRTTGQVHTQSVAHPHAILGRAPQAGVRLDDPSVSQCHAHLQLVDGVPYCIDLGSRTGVMWDDGGRGRGWIHPGQTVRIGMFDVQITGNAPPATAGEPERTAPGSPPGALATLDVHSPMGPSGCFTLDLPVTLIGRHPACNLRFLDEAAAYFQCALVKTREGIWCVDLLSRSGTVVNGRATRSSQLRDGDLIEIGRVSLLLRVGSATAPPLALFGPSGIRPTNSAATDSVSAVITPLREMMEQFQQCFVTMARMFTTMQQEHTAMMCEQMRQVQELLRESREAPPKAQVTLPAALPPAPPTIPSAPPAPAPPPKPPTPKIVSPDETRHLTDAHSWFLDRMSQKGTATENKPN